MIGINVVLGRRKKVTNFALGIKLKQKTNG